MKIKLLTITAIFCCIMAFSGCSSAKESEIGTGVPNPDEIVPSMEELTDNLTDNGYTVETFDKIYDTNVSGKRVYAEKGSKYIDICYGLDDTSADSVFSAFEDKYVDTDYYILAQNGNYVYCVTDKKTFRKSGFKSTDNIGTQYINE